jgi:hypothetical protein
MYGITASLTLLARLRRSSTDIDMENYLSVSYPVLKDEASSVQGGFTLISSSAGSGGSQLPHPMPLVKAWTILKLT